MSKVIQIVLRFGPLVAAFALALAAALEPVFPGYTGIVTQVLSFLGIVGLGPDAEVLELLSELLAAALVLVGVARKVFALIKAKLEPQQS